MLKYIKWYMMPKHYLILITLTYTCIKFNHISNHFGTNKVNSPEEVVLSLRKVFERLLRRMLWPLKEGSEVEECTKQLNFSSSNVNGEREAFSSVFTYLQYLDK